MFFATKALAKFSRNLHLEEEVDNAKFQPKSVHKYYHYFAVISGWHIIQCTIYVIVEDISYALCEFSLARCHVSPYM
jgi:hypothetical protein